MQVHTIKIHMLTPSEFQAPLGQAVSHMKRKASGPSVSPCSGRIQQPSRCRVPKESRSVLFKANLQFEFPQPH
jgi:hypothetical protein